MSQPDEFYIGYLDQAPAALGKRLRALAFALPLLLVGLAAWLAAEQRAFAPALFAFGVERSWQGTVVLTPHPALLIQRPGNGGVSRVPLVGPFKSGASDAVAPFDQRAVSLAGTLVARDGQSMIELKPDSLRPLGDQAALAAEGALALGQGSFRGEIVDSKCFLGVMNPGETKVHRACAVRCISGGIPPVLLVRDTSGRVTYLMLVGPSGRMINREILDLVAEPVEITGTLERHQELLVLRADPNTIQRL
ncbi:MAG: hypothetical protein DHS20C15_15240 [Planctomycetota bacterium]|nr:MAG: hypothetical protein DHS20C15_15240 [Planctomycetota bacterium]